MLRFFRVALSADAGGAAGGGGASGAGGGAGAGAGGAGSGSAGGAGSGSSGGAAGGNAAGGAGNGGGAAAGSGAAPPAVTTAGGLVAAAGQAAPAPQGAADPAGGPQPYYPQGLADGFKGKTDRDTIDALHKHMSGLPKAPGKPGEYAFEPSADLANVISAKDDKVLPIFQDVAHKLGLSQEQFSGVVNGVFGEMVKAGMMPAPVDVAAEFSKLGGQGDAQTRMQNGQQRVVDVANGLEGLVARKELDQGQAHALRDAIGSADALIAVERLLALAGGDANGGPRMGGQPTGSRAPSMADFEARQADPRYQWSSGKFDQRFYDETNRIFEQIPR